MTIIYTSTQRILIQIYLRLFRLILSVERYRDANNRLIDCVSVADIDAHKTFVMCIDPSLVHRRVTNQFVVFVCGRTYRRRAVINIHRDIVASKTINRPG